MKQIIESASNDFKNNSSDWLMSINIRQCDWDRPMKVVYINEKTEQVTLEYLDYTNKDGLRYRRIPYKILMKSFFSFSTGMWQIK